ncbi:MAG: LysR family transcriptional regulator [Myxococcota bacterium]
MHSTLRSLDLNLLTALDALLDEHSVAKAAARLHLSPPAMSRTLGRIREATGDPILARAGRRLVPTPLALAMRERVRQVVAEAAALLSPVAPVEPARFERRLALRVDDAVTAVLGPPLMAALQERAPGVTLVFRAEGDEDVDALRDGRVDLDLGVQGALGLEIRTRKLIDDERVVLTRGCSRRRRPMSLRQLAAREHIDVSRRGRVRGPLDEVLAAAGLARTVRAVVPNQLAAAVLVAQSDLVSLVSRAFARAIGATLDVGFAPLPVSLGTVPIALAWHPRFDADPVHAWLRDELRRIVAAGRG